MPFTPSHAVVALPFVRATPGFAAAVAMGAMTPDLPLFVRGLPLSYAVTHGLVWLPLTALVAGLLLLVWWQFIRPGVRELSPRWLAERLPEAWDARPRLRVSFRRAAILFLGLVLGAASHLGWDSFTHAGLAGTRLLGLDAYWGALPAYQWLQYGSSVLGLAALILCGAVWLGRLRREHPAPAPVHRALPDAVRIGWWASLPVTLLLAWIAGSVLLEPVDPEFAPQHLAFRVLLPAVALWGALSVLLCMLIPLRRGLSSVERRA